MVESFLPSFAVLECPSHLLAPPLVHPLNCPILATLYCGVLILGPRSSKSVKHVQKTFHKSELSQNGRTVPYH